MTGDGRMAVRRRFVAAPSARFKKILQFILIVV